MYLKSEKPCNSIVDVRLDLNVQSIQKMYNTKSTAIFITLDVLESK